MAEQIRMSILVRNAQGATEGFVGTRSAINRWLTGWQDPENLTATITDESGEIVCTKPMGRKRIPWPGR